MKSTQPQLASWARTTSPDIAAACSVLGIPIQVDQTIDAKTGRGWKTILLGLESVPSEAIGGKIVEGAPDPTPNFRTQSILGLIRKGELQKSDPHHPALDVLRACAAADCLQEACRSGMRYRLARVSGVQRFRFVPGEEPQTIKAAQAIWRTRDLKLAACMSVLGVPLTRIDAEGKNHAFLFSMLAYQLAPDVPAIVPSDLALALRAGSLHEQHPLLWMMQGLKNRDAILDFINGQRRMVMIRAEGTGRASLVPEDASSRTLDRVRQHLRII